MAHPESGRQNLSSGLLRIVDHSGITYEEMQPGLPITIHAIDAKTRQPGNFLLSVASVRTVDEGAAKKAATFQYQAGEFTFFDGDNPARTLKLKPGDLIENGITARMIPQTDYHMSYFGGIGISPIGVVRDHSFEYINGSEQSIIAHHVQAIDVGAAAPDYKSLNLSDHLAKVARTKDRLAQQSEKKAEEVNRIMMGELENRFRTFPEFEALRDLIAQYSPNGKVTMVSYLIYAKEDGVLEQAWTELQRADKEHFQYDPPFVRGDMDLKGSNRWELMKMMQTAGVKWPRPNKKEEDPEGGNVIVIKRPDDQELQAKLQRKLAEYQRRLESRDREMIVDAQHKAFILQTVLESGEADKDKIKKLVSSEPWFDEGTFEVAADVINEYCSMGDKTTRVRGGTGLR